MPPKVPRASSSRATVPKQRTGATQGSAVSDIDTWRTELFRSVEPRTIVQRSNASGGERYEGQVSDDGKRHGKGILWWPNGNVYAGEWAAGAMCGSGTFHYAAEGDRYTGGFQDDKKHGGGKYTFANGNSYGGEFACDKRHGRGKYSWMCGDEYDGEWLEGRMHGQGVTAYANGNKYVGSFVEDRREGRGRLTCTDGLSYDGEWLNNNRHGAGRLDFPSGDFYEGEWQLDKKDGQGRDSFANGNEYRGQYRANAKHGVGRMTYNNGDVYDGHWSNDKMHGRGKYCFSNGFVYDGEWQDDMRHGSGTYTFPNGHVYIGGWANDRRHGEGQLTLSSSASENAGETYKGTWRDGKMHGDFAVSDAQSRLLYRGAWREGAPSGEGEFWVPIGEAAVVVAGTLDVTAAAKKGLGTIDRLPPVVEAIAKAAQLHVRSCDASADATLHPFPMCVVSEPSMSSQPDAPAAASCLEALRKQADDACAEQRALTMEAAVDAQRLVVAASQAASATRKALAAGGCLADADDGLRAANAELERLHGRQTSAEAELSVRQKTLADAKVVEADNAAAADSLKQRVLDLRQRVCHGESVAKEAREAADRLAALGRSLAEAESAAAAAEVQSSDLKSGEMREAEDAKERGDHELEVAKERLKQTEAQVTCTQKRTREAAAEQKSSVKQITEAVRELDLAIASHNSRQSKAAADIAALHDAIDAQQRQRQRHKKTVDEVVAALQAEAANVEEELTAVASDVDDVRAESESIANECDKRVAVNTATAKEVEKLRLQQKLFTDDEAVEQKRASVARERLASARAEIDLLSHRSEEERSLQQLQASFDRELLTIETDAKHVETQVSNAKASCAALKEKLADSLNVRAAPSGSGVRRIQSMRKSSTPPAEEDGKVQELGEQLRATRKKITKKREKLAVLHREAQEACASWLPRESEATAGVLASASREAQLNQVMKLRGQLDRVLKECESAEALLVRATQPESASDDGDDCVDDDERYVRDIVRSMRSADRDWRVNYLLDQLAARQQQVADLQRDAAYAKKLEQQVLAANNAVSGFKQQPRSAGPRSADHTPLRSTPGLARHDARAL
uniref:Uncharacterized protein n=1 Tax=Neobodo designis TaxID=312471 RepID=A0A7S1QV67_NEODS